MHQKWCINIITIICELGVAPRFCVGAPSTPISRPLTPISPQTALGGGKRRRPIGEVPLRVQVLIFNHLTTQVELSI